MLLLFSKKLCFLTHLTATAASLFQKSLHKLSMEHYHCNNKANILGSIP